MSKYVVVDTLPTELRAHEYAIPFPTFLEEIEANKNREPRGGLTGVNYIRFIVGSIGTRYDQENLNSYTIRPYGYEGLKYSSDKEMSDIIVKLLKEQVPTIFQKYVEDKLKSAPNGTKVIYLERPFGTMTLPFRNNAIEQIKESDVDVELGHKAKKVVGKPAVTKEEASNS